MNLFKETSVYDVGLTILSAVSVALSGVGRPPARVLMYPGTVAWDNCDCGQLALGVTTHRQRLKQHASELHRTGTCRVIRVVDRSVCPGHGHQRNSTRPRSADERVSDPRK